MTFIEWAFRAGEGRTIVLDIDGTLVPAGESAVSPDVVEAVFKLKERNTVFLFSNKHLPERNRTVAHTLGISLIQSSYRKPNPKVLRGVSEDVIVVGDKHLTDGLLAFFSGAEFIRVARVTAAQEPILDKIFNAIDDVAGQTWYFFKCLRPEQWSKNILIFVPLFFAHAVFNPAALMATAAVFIAFCFISSATYIANDMADVATDREHPTKRFRPLARGDVTVQGVVFLGVTLFLSGALFAFLFAPLALPVLCVYALSSVFYSVYGKHLPIIEMLMFIWFYFARMLAGALAASVPLSAWFTLAVVFLALFMIAAKRYTERMQDRSRAVLAHYSPLFLQSILIVSAALVVAFYALYTVLGEGSTLAVYSTIPVVSGIVRYLQLSLGAESAESPERLIITDPGLLAAGTVWFLMMVAVFYF
ncbi:UbiA family prenyltransferase [Candidatus Nomurabacteria bacterium]|nr:UbiA family prenyltransferase [Candidatus Nomurabacteria bacterium]